MNTFLVLSLIGLVLVLLDQVQLLDQEQRDVQKAKAKQTWFKRLDQKYYCKVTKEQLERWRTENWDD